MNINDQEDTTIYKVVVNHEQQYSIYPADRANPLGWNDAGKTGPKQSVWLISRKFGPTCAR